MKKICILCSDADVILARENTRKIFEKDIKTLELPSFFNKDKIIHDYLSIPVSQTGQLPTTHWFCFLNTNDETYDKIMGNVIYSIIEESGPKEFLEKWNLQIIK